MSIKQLSLERKRWYRTGKVIILLLPLVIAVILFVKGRIHIPAMTQKNFATMIDKNIRYVFGAIVGYGIYALLIYAIQNLILYIGFGGVEHDKTKDMKMIKQSYLEKKLLYRVAKVIFWTLPLLVIVILFSKKYLHIPSITLKNFGTVVSQNNMYIM